MTLDEFKKLEIKPEDLVCVYTHRPKTTKRVGSIWVTESYLYYRSGHRVPVYMLTTYPNINGHRHPLEFIKSIEVLIPGFWSDK